MNKIFFVIVFTLIFVACSAHQLPLYEKDKRPQDPSQYSGIEGAIQKQKDEAYLANEANKFKCQDARLDLVDAEAGWDVNLIRRVKVRVQKLCVVQK